MRVRDRCALCRWERDPSSRPPTIEETVEDMTNACLHGEPKGSRYCALCRHAGIGVELLEGAPGELLGAADWERKAKKVIWAKARSGDRFTSEDITEVIGFPDTTHRPNGRNNRIGALISSVARDYRITIVDEAKARNPQSNGRTIKVWQGKEHR